MQSSKEEGAWPWGRQTCMTCTSMCEHQRHLRTQSKVWTAAKITWMVKKMSWALSLNEVTSKYTPVLFPDNMDFSIFNAIRTDVFTGACSSLLVGLCWGSCRSSHPTSMFWQCPYSSLSTGKDHKLQLSCSQLQPWLARYRPSSGWILLLLLPTSAVKLRLKSSLSCWSAEN